MSKIGEKTPPELPDTDLVPNARYSGPSRDQVIKMRKDYISPSLFHFYPNDPLIIVDGKMQYLWDEGGKRYLDFFAGVATVNVGHCNPAVMGALENQLKTFWHGSQLYLNDVTSLYAKELIDAMPPDSGLDTVFFCNSGSEACDFAIHMARTYTGLYDVIGLRNGYHGQSAIGKGATAVCGWRHVVPYAFGIHHVAAPDPYRGCFGNDTDKYLCDLEDVIRNIGASEMPKNGQIAAFIAEGGVQGVGGAVVFPEDYCRRVCDLIHKYGGLYISDEVQTGFGRLGTMFGFEDGSVKYPDIVTMAKGIGNGLPLAAVVCRREIAEPAAKTLTFNTFGGNPLICAGGREVLKITKEPSFLESVKERGKQMMDGLKVLKDKYASLVGDVRGKGLMLGVELVRGNDKQPAAKETVKTLDLCRKYGLLIGQYGNVLRLKPPLCVSKQDCQFALDVLDFVFSEIDS